MNQLTVSGSCGNGTEFSTTKGGKTVAKFSIAVKTGKEKTDMFWLSVTMWEPTETFIPPEKGDYVVVTGNLSVSTGAKDNKTYINCNAKQALVCAKQDK